MPFQNLVPLRRWVVILLTIYLAVTLVSVWSDFLEIQFWHKLKSGSFPDAEAMSRAAAETDARGQILWLTTIGTFIVTGIVCLVWTFRAARNAMVLDREPPRHSPGSAVWWYFVPIANLWKPYQTMAELWDRSAWPANRDGVILGWWWALWIGTTLLGNASYRIVRRSETIDSYQLSAWLGFWTDVLDVALIIFYAAIIIMITRMQIARHAALPKVSAATGNNLQPGQYR